ncbi:MAG: BatA and WFA domain-containing protein [Clostridia bacterium]|nr:BatA and WFA domain-containing protein [Clostridia bacterium]
MTFLYPLGLLGLIGVPILILIYIIKNKYTEQTIASTYLWTLSEQFLKRKRRPPKITGLLSLILQLVLVIAISLTIANPVLIFPDAAKEYCFILDGSGSMQMQTQGVSRFDRAKEKITELLDSSMEGSVYTVLYLDGSTTNIVCERLEDKEEVKTAVAALEPSYAEAVYTDALELAQGYFDGNAGLSAYLITDKPYAHHENVEIVDVSQGEQNYALSDIMYTYEQGLLTVETGVYSYASDARLDVQLFLNENAEVVETKRADTTKGELCSVQFQIRTEEFRSLRIVVAAEDAFTADNERTIYNAENENSYEALIVSEEPEFIRWVLESVSETEIEVLTKAQYEKAWSSQAPGGYGLYIYDCYAPKALPKDGTVWFFNLDTSIEGTGFSVQTEVELDKGAPLKLTQSSSSTSKALTVGLKGENLYVSKYMKYGLYDTFTTIYSYNGQPLVFTGDNGYGNREVVFAFSLSNSNIVMSSDFVMLVRNLVKFSFPDVIEKGTYNSGERLEINVPPACSAITIYAPDGTVSYAMSQMEANEYVLATPGVYTVTLTIGEADRTYHVCAHIPETESDVTAAGQSFALNGEAQEGGLDGKYDDLIILFILIGLVFMGDWAVYCYDKYQLR